MAKVDQFKISSTTHLVAEAITGLESRHQGVHPHQSAANKAMRFFHRPVGPQVLGLPTHPTSYHSDFLAEQSARGHFTAPHYATTGKYDDCVI